MWLRPKTSFLKILRGDDWNSEPEDANQWRNLFSFPSVRLFRSNKLLHWSPNHLKIKEKKSILNTAVTVCVNVPCNRCQVCSDLVVVVQRIKKKQRPNQGGGGEGRHPGWVRHLAWDLIGRYKSCSYKINRPTSRGSKIGSSTAGLNYFHHSFQNPFQPAMRQFFRLTNCVNHLLGQMPSFLFLCNRFLNMIIILTLLTPAAVNYYRATWYMLDLFVFPDDKPLSASFTFTVSFGTLFLIMLVGDYIKESLNARKAKEVWYRVLFFPLAFLTVAAWKGPWMLLDQITTPSLPSACVSHVMGFLVLVCTRTTSSIVAMPGYCSNERHINLSESILQGKHYVKNTSNTICGEIAARIFNSFVTVFIIGVAVVNYWRGTWLIILTTLQYLDNDLILSSVLLIIVGYSIWIVCYVLTEFLSTIPMNPPHSILNRALEQVFVYILAFGVVCSWAGIWLLMDACLPSGKSIIL